MAVTNDVFVRVKSGPPSGLFKAPYRFKRLSELLEDMIPKLGITIFDLNGNPDGLVLDADGDTTISAPIDDQIDIEINSADDFTFTANTFTALSGSALKTNTINETTAASGVTIDGALVKDGMATFTSAADGVITIDADTTDHTAGNVVAIDLGVNSASVNALDISADVKTLLSAAETVKSINIDTNALASDADTSAVIGVDITASSVATSRADIKGVRVTLDGAMSTADTIYGIETGFVTGSTFTGGSEKAGIFINSDATLNHASETHYGLLVDLRDVINTSSSEIAGIKMRLEDDAKGLFIDASTVTHAAGNLIDVDADAKDIASGDLKGVNVNIDETVVGTDGTKVVGNDVTITGFATGRADLIGSRITFDGTKNGGDNTVGLIINADSLTLNHASENFRGIHVDASGLTNTASSVLYGAHIEVPATATAAIQTDGLINSTKNAGTPFGGTVTAVETGDGKDMTTTLTLTNFIVGALDGAAAAKGIGNICYTFPAGQHLELVYSLASIVLTAVGTAVATDTGLGSVIASGVISVLSGTTTFEDRLTGQAINTAAGGGTAVSALTASTAGVATGIALNVAASVKNVFLNSAGTWNANNTGNLTATGTVVLKWTRMQ